MYKLIKRKINEDLWPVAQFKDCSKGTTLQRYKAYMFNKENADILILPILNWVALTIIFYSFLYFFDFLSKKTPTMVYLCALSSILMTFCVIGAIILLISYIFLTGQTVKFEYGQEKERAWYD